MTRWGGTPATGPDHAHETLPVRSEVRLRMKTHLTGDGLDGAWWPRTRDPEAEFPELVLVASSWVGPVSRVTYHVDDWTTAGHEVTIDGWPVELVGSTTMQPHTVRVTGTHQRERALLVVPPGVPGGVARAVLRAAAGAEVMRSAEEVLRANGVRHNVDER